MPDSPLIVPVLITNGSLQFATISNNGTVQDVIDVLTRQPEVREGVLNDLQSNTWALQKIRKEHNGRTWEEEELESLDDGEGALGFYMIQC
jgi:diaphanous 1